MNLLRDTANKADYQTILKLTDGELHAVFSNCPDRCNGKNFDLNRFDSDKYNKYNPGSMLASPSSEYYSVCDLNRKQTYSCTEYFSNLHFNI